MFFFAGSTPAVFALTFQKHSLNLRENDSSNCR